MRRAGVATLLALAVRTNAQDWQTIADRIGRSIFEVPNSVLQSNLADTTVDTLFDRALQGTHKAYP